MELNFLFYNDNTGSGEWHDTIMALSPAAKTGEQGSRGRAVPSAISSEAGENMRQLVRRLVSFASEFSLYGNLWQQWMTYMLMMHENPFTLACERRTVSESSTMMKLADKDFAILREMYMTDLAALDKQAGTDMISMMADYRIPYAQETESSAGKQIRMLTSRLARSRDTKEFGHILTQYYAEYGIGIYGLYRAFRVTCEDEAVAVVPVRDTEDVRFQDLVGYEEQKKTLIENTAAFVNGAHANNVLLYGDSGTGKSTSIHALMHDFYSKGLRLVEISKAERKLLPQVLSLIKQRNYRFIIYLDDLSFEENESDYKELKAMLEGALETRSDRVLIYATSNRRHLIRETWRDRNDMEYQEDIHHSDTMEEKLSLASRFGVTIYYSKPTPKEYLEIVRQLAKRHGIEMEEEELMDAARKWELRHGGMSGRTASQLITWLERR